AVPGPLTDSFAAKARALGAVSVFCLYERDGQRPFRGSPVLAGGGTHVGRTPSAPRTRHACCPEQGGSTPGVRLAPASRTLVGRTRMVHITEYACFHEQGYYTPGDKGAPAYRTRAGMIGVAICYDRHYPEYLRALALAGADLVVVPQAGSVGEWPEGLYEA